VNVIDIGIFANPVPARVAIARHCLMAHFLNLYRHDFDRVVICDLDSSIIQADPFTSSFTADILGLPIWGGEYPSRVLLNELQRVDPQFEKDFYLDKEILSDQLIYGAVPVVLRLYEIVLRHERIRSREAAESFGAYLNYCSANGLFTRKNFRPQVTRPGDDFVFTPSETAIVATWDGGGRCAFGVDGASRRPLVLATGMKRAFLLESACARQTAPTKAQWKEGPRYEGRNSHR
jgi:hypothetical protein